MKMIHTSHNGLDAFIHEHVSLFSPRTRADVYIYRDNTLMNHYIIRKDTETKLIAFAKSKMEKMSVNVKD